MQSARATLPPQVVAYKNSICVVQGDIYLFNANDGSSRRFYAFAGTTELAIEEDVLYVNLSKHPHYIVRALQMNTRTVSIDASWSMLYGNVQSAKAAADVVALGTIESIKNVTQSGPGLIFTDFVFKIEQSIVDPHHMLSGSTIIVHQTGGVVNGVQYEVEDDPLFQINEHALLFLQIYQPGYAFVIGGPSGRFIVQNNLVQPRNNQKGMTSMRNQSVPVANFVAQIQSA